MTAKLDTVTLEVIRNALPAVANEMAADLQRTSYNMPIILLLYGTPQITILPLFILYFGIGPASKIAFGVSHGCGPRLGQ